MTDPIKSFTREVEENIKRLAGTPELIEKSMDWMVAVGVTGNYTYNFNWQGRPVIQYPQDLVAIQELIWKVRPDLIIETGIAHGGSLIFYASMLAQLDLTDAIQNKTVLDPQKSNRSVLGIDIDIRSHNRKAIESHPMSTYINMLEGSSTSPSIIEQVKQRAEGVQCVMVCLDSNHTHEHVLAELEAYASLTTKGSYCIVLDTLIEDTPEEVFSNRPWGPGNNPKTAVWEYLKKHPEFEIDKKIHQKLLVTVAPDGYLKRIG